MNYLRNPDEIYQASFEAISKEVNLSKFPKSLHNLVLRLVHAIAIPEIIDDIVWHGDVVSSASINLAKAAIKEKANYIAFGAFFSTKTKKVKYLATTKILDKVKKLTRIPLVAIGGINLSNYKKLLLNNANLLAISSYVWNNKKYKPFEAIEKIK